MATAIGLDIKLFFGTFDLKYDIEIILIYNYK